MTLNRSLLVAIVAMASYLVLSGIAAVIVGGFWKSGRANWADIPARARASRLATLRILPAALVAIVTIAFVLPLYLSLEPPSEFEQVGPVVAIALLAGALMSAKTFFCSLRRVTATARLRRRWMRGATPFKVNGVQAYAIHSVEPIVALVGIWRPTLVVSRIVLDACSETEVAQIIRHERAHLIVRDNLKRFLMGCLPDVLSVTPAREAIARAWRNAAEDAADEAVTCGEPGARVELAALLLKVAGLAPATLWQPAIASSFVNADNLERRVRQLVRDEVVVTRTPTDHVAGGLLIAIAVVLSLMLFNAETGTIVHGAIEAVISLGR